MPTYDIDRYLHVRSAYGASLSADGGQLAFLENTTGVPQVWTLDSPRGWPEQRTFHDERVTFVSWSPTRAELVYGMDEGGNEREQLHRLDLDSGISMNLTRHPDAKHRWGGWSHDGDRVAFASNRRDGSVFDVYVQGRTEIGNDARLVVDGDGWLSLAGWSPDDTRLLVVEAHSSFDQDLHVLDVESGAMRHLTPHEGDVRYTGPEWGPDGESLYVATDRASDTCRLERLDLESATFEVVESGGDWEVDGVAVHESGRLVYSRNVDGYTELNVGTLAEPTTLDADPVPDLPGGVAGGVSFAPDGDRFACSASGDTANTNVYVVDAATGETERWTAASTAGIPPETFVGSDLVRYGTFDDREIPAFFSVPDGTGPFPVVVDIHGGPESQRRPSFAPVKQYLLNHGYAVFEPNVRGSSGYGAAYAALDDVGGRMDSVADVEAAVEWLTAREAVDPDRIVAMGGSYGGFMVLSALTTYPDLWAAGVDVVGIANFVTFLENTGDWRRSLREAEYGSLDGDRELLERISPINHLDAIDAPLFVLHGANDPRVPVDEAHQVAAAAREQGVPVRERIFDDEGHGFSKLENRITAYREIVEFLDEHV